MTTTTTTTTTKKMKTTSCNVVIGRGSYFVPFLVVGVSSVIVSTCGVSAFQQQQQHQQVPRSSLSRTATTSPSPSSSSSLSSLFNDEDEDDDVNGGVQEGNNSNNMSRRNIFENSAKALLIGITTPFLPSSYTTDPANAMLLQFPIISTPTMRSKIGDGTMTQDQQEAARKSSPDHQSRTLKNYYHFIRAGTSELESTGIYSTNPLFLTNRENALSDEGYNTLQKSLKTLKAAPPAMSPTIVFHSLAANGMDTGDYIAREIHLGRDRLLPEFTYLDQRGIGLWDSSSLEDVKPAIWAMDSMEAGKEGFQGRPPANTDGTPNDTLHDQFTRLRQFISLQETRSSGDTILVIFPDGTGPALLSCMIAGIPFEDVHTLEYQPGELRLDVTPESIRELYEKRRYDKEYLDIIADGKIKLEKLRNTKPSAFATSYKDSMANAAEEDADNDFYDKKNAEAATKRQLEEEKRAALQTSIQESRMAAQEKKQKKEQQESDVRDKKQLLIVERQKQFEEKKVEKEKKKEELTAVFEAAKKKKTDQKEKQRQEALLSEQQQNERRQEAKSKSTSPSTSTTTFTPPSSVPSFGLSLPPDVLSKVVFGTLGAVVTAGAVISADNEDEEDIEKKKKKSASVAVPITTKKYKEYRDEPLVAVNANTAAATATANATVTAAATATVNVTATTQKTTTKKYKEYRDEPLIAINAVAAAAAATTTHNNNDMKKDDALIVHHHSNSSRFADGISLDETEKLMIPVMNITNHKDVKSSSHHHHGHHHSSATKSHDELLVVSSSAEAKDTDDVAVEKELEKLATAEQRYKKSLKEVAANNKKKLQEQLQQEQEKDRTTPTMRSSLYDTPLPVTITKTTAETTTHTDDDDDDVDEYADDEGDWLRVLSEIGNDVYDEEQYDDGDDWDITGNNIKKKKNEIIGAAVFDNDVYDENDDEEDDWDLTGTNSKKKKILGAAVFDTIREE